MYKIIWDSPIPIEITLSTIATALAIAAGVAVTAAVLFACSVVKFVG